MNHPLGYCIDHGLFLATGYLVGAAAQNIRILESRQTCPHCRRLCEVVPGAYSTLGGHLNVLLDPSVSPAALAAIRAIVLKAQRQEYSHERARAEVCKISPQVGRLFDVADWDPVAKATLYASIIAAISALGVAGIAGTAHVIASRPYTVQHAASPDPIFNLPDIGPVPIFRPK